MANKEYVLSKWNQVILKPADENDGFWWRIPNADLAGFSEREEDAWKTMKNLTQKKVKLVQKANKTISKLSELKMGMK